MTLNDTIRSVKTQLESCVEALGSLLETPIGPIPSDQWSLDHQPPRTDGPRTDGPRTDGPTDLPVEAPVPLFREPELASRKEWDAKFRAELDILAGVKKPDDRLVHLTRMAELVQQAIDAIHKAEREFKRL